MLLKTAPLKTNTETLEVFSTLEKRKLKIKPFIYGLLGDMPELDSYALKVAKPNACRTCYDDGTVRNLIMEYYLNKSSINLVRIALEANAVLSPKMQPQFQLLKEISMHPIKSALSPHLIGGIPPLIDDLDHTFESGVGENIFKHILKTMPLDNRGILIIWWEFISEFFPIRDLDIQTKWSWLRDSILEKK